MNAENDPLKDSEERKKKWKSERERERRKRNRKKERNYMNRENDTLQHINTFWPLFTTLESKVPAVEKFKSQVGWY